MDKPYKLGILVGRFQTIHAGHEKMVNTALQLCEQVGIFVGSSQEALTSKNPFSYEIREEMLHAVFGDAIRVYPLPDIGVGNNSRWGEYVLRNVLERFGMMPDLLVSGKESRRLDWFDGVSGLAISELYIPKTIDISATQMRQFFLRDDFESWKNRTNPKLWSKYPELRQIVLASQARQETDSI